MRDCDESYDEDVIFLREFRKAGLKSVRYACAVTAVLLILFMASPELSNQHSTEAWQIRFVMLVYIASLVYLTLRNSEFAVKYYAIVVSSSVIFLLTGIAILIAKPTFQSISVDFSPIPAMFLALIISYGFLRLPLWIVSIFCVSFSFLVVYAAPHGFSGAGQLRLVLYLICTNCLGMLLCHSIESRERELFRERRRAEAAQAESQARARAAEEAHAEKTRLLEAVSHDLRQPMMAVSTSVAVLQSKLAKGELEVAKVQAARIGDSIGMLGATLEHLLTTARYDGGTEPISIQMVDLQPILEELELTFAEAARAKGIELRIRIPEQRVVVTSDATALWRVLMNLVSNAIKFTESAGRPGRGVLLRTFLGDGICRIEVADTGVGIAKEDLESIWQAYFQVGNTERNRVRGLGLGLFLVRRALDHLPGHSLALRSRVGKGSRFTIRLPGSALGSSNTPGRRGEPLSREMLEVIEGAYVLVLEDDVDARSAILDLLDDWGVLHASAATLDELIEEVGTDARAPDALITDFRLPGARSGGQCILELRQIVGEEFPAIVVTGEADTAAIRRSLPAGAVVLQKPFDAGALAVPLLAAVERARRAESL